MLFHLCLDKIFQCKVQFKTLVILCMTSIYIERERTDNVVLFINATVCCKITIPSPNETKALYTNCIN